MHGRLKVRTTEEQKLLKEKEQKRKLVAYRTGIQKILATRNKENYDPESLAISTQILLLNPDIYTLWNFRKEAVLMEIKNSKSDPSGDNSALKLFLENEISLTEQCLLANPKSYGSWHHRYWILNHHPEPNWQKEFQLCNKYLSMDDRNFHCWDYRRLITNKIGVSLEEEMKFSTERLNENFSNYSSWHYRSTLRKLDATSAEAELDLVQNAVFTDPTDSSAWFYLRWVLSHEDIPQERRLQLLQSLNELHDLEPDCKWIVMAKCWVTKSICDMDNLADDGRLSYYKELIKLDPLREGQYREYLNKHGQ